MCSAALQQLFPARKAEPSSLGKPLYFDVMDSEESMERANPLAQSDFKKNDSRRMVQKSYEPFRLVDLYKKTKTGCQSTKKIISNHAAEWVEAYEMWRRKV